MVCITRCCNEQAQLQLSRSELHLVRAVSCHWLTNAFWWSTTAAGRLLQDEARSMKVQRDREDVVFW